MMGFYLGELKVVDLKSMAKKEHEIMLAKKEFTRDSKKAVIEYLRVKFGFFWFIRISLIDLMSGGWFYQLRCTPFFRNKDHWFFKKWYVSGNHIYGFCASSINDKDICFSV